MLFMGSQSKWAEVITHFTEHNLLSFYFVSHHTAREKERVTLHVHSQVLSPVLANISHLRPLLQLLSSDV